MEIFHYEDQKKSVQLVTATAGPETGGEGRGGGEVSQQLYLKTNINISIIHQLFVFYFSVQSGKPEEGLVSNIYPFSRGISGYFSST